MFTGTKLFQQIHQYSITDKYFIYLHGTSTLPPYPYRQKHRLTLKKSLGPLVLLSPPPVNTTDYTKMMEASKNNELNELLDKPSNKRFKKRSEIFIKGKQNTLNDILHLIANIITYSRFWTGCTIDSPVSPTIVDILLELADELPSAEHKIYDYKYSHTHKYISHKSFTHIFNIFSVLVSNTTFSNLIRILRVNVPSMYNHTMCYYISQKNYCNN